MLTCARDRAVPPHGGQVWVGLQVGQPPIQKEWMWIHWASGDRPLGDTQRDG